MNDLEHRLRAALEDLAPSDPSTAGLTDAAVRYHRRARARRLAVGAIAALVVLVGGGLVASMLEPAGRPVPAGPLRIAPGTCPPPAATASGASDPVAAWICPDPAAAAEGDGWVLPVAPLTGRYAKAVWVPEYGYAVDCQGLPRGPAFTLTMQEGDGATRTYRSSGSVCAAMWTVASYFTALADLDADTRAAATPEEAVACRSVGQWEDTRDGTNLDSPFVAANLCFVPSYYHSIDRSLKTPPPLRPRSYRAAPLPPDTLAKLNRDLTSARGGFFGNGECLIEGNWTYTILGWTASGHSRMLWTGCLDELHVAGTIHFGFIPSPDTTAALRALVPKD